MLTLEYMLTEDENKYFDRKSARVKPSEIADLISAFANAEGGTIVIGISDKRRLLEGINEIGSVKINDLVAAPKDCCKPMPAYTEEFIDVINRNGDTDRLLLLHVHAAVDQIIRTNNDSTFLRIGDRTKEIKGDDLKNLEYSKATRHYEDEINVEAEIEDLSEELLSQYKKKLGAESIDTKQVLKARGFIKKKDGKEYLTNGAVLLFAENIYQFYPNCRIRFIRYDGITEQVGTNINIIKDVNIEYCLLRIIVIAKTFVEGQLREFTALNQDTGQFQNVPEYPEFAWLEGLVNAVTHREYGMTGSHIKISMFDDRLEILSPGKLPSIVTVNNIKETRFSRNPRIARVLTEFGWVRELNEGVKRIYSDMADFFLDEPMYSEPEQSVKLVLKNNIVMRHMRSMDRALENIGADIWDDLDDLEKTIITYMSSKASVTRSELCEMTGKSNGTISNRLNKLMDAGVILQNGNKYDPNHTYSLLVK